MAERSAEEIADLISGNNPRELDNTLAAFTPNKLQEMFFMRNASLSGETLLGTAVKTGCVKCLQVNHSAQNQADYIRERSVLM